MFNSPFTTIGGLLVAIGTALSSVQEPQWLHWAGQIFMGIGSLMLGINAKDN